MTLDPAATVTSVAAGVSETQPYTSPTTAERVDAGIGLARLAIGDLAGAATLLGPLGFTITTDLDPATGRRYAMAVSETDPDPARVGTVSRRPVETARAVYRGAAPEVRCEL